MCRSIKRLHNLVPPVSDEEIRDAALQFVRKIYGATKPTKANEAAFLVAVDDIAETAKRLLDSLEATGTPTTREAIKERQKQRFERQTKSITV